MRGLIMNPVLKYNVGVFLFTAYYKSEISTGRLTPLAFAEEVYEERKH